MKWFKAIPVLRDAAGGDCPRWRAAGSSKESTGGHIDDTVVTTKVKTALFQ